LQEPECDFPSSNSIFTVTKAAITRRRTANITYMKCFQLLLITKDVKCINEFLLLYAKPLLFKLVLEFSVRKEQESKDKLEWN